MKLYILCITYSTVPRVTLFLSNASFHNAFLLLWHPSSRASTEDDYKPPSPFFLPPLSSRLGLAGRRGLGGGARGGEGTR